MAMSSTEKTFDFIMKCSECTDGDVMELHSLDDWEYTDINTSVGQCKECKAMYYITCVPEREL